MNMIARQQLIEETPRAVKLYFVTDEAEAEPPRARMVEARSLDDGQLVAVLGFHAMAKWLELGSFSYICGTNGIWARLQ